MPNTKVWCDTGLTTNTQARKEKTATVKNLHATVNELKTSMEDSVVEVTKLFAHVSHQIDVHEDMQGELQLMKDLESYERILHTDVPSGKKVWSTRWCHSFFDVPGLVVVRILLCTIQDSSSRPLKLRTTADMSGSCRRRSMT